MLIGVAGLVAFIIAGIFELVKQHLDAVIWLIIVGGILLSVQVIFGYYGWYGRRTGG